LVVDHELCRFVRKRHLLDLHPEVDMRGLVRLRMYQQEDSHLHRLEQLRQYRRQTVDLDDLRSVRGLPERRSGLRRDQPIPQRLRWRPLHVRR
jgi:hypothetical protein